MPASQILGGIEFGQMSLWRLKSVKAQTSVAGGRLGVGNGREKLPVSMELGISGGIGLLFGVVLAWLALRSRSAALQARLSFTEKELAAAKAELARLLEDQQELVASRARLESALESERKTSNEKIDIAHQGRGRTCRMRSRLWPPML